MAMHMPRGVGGVGGPQGGGLCLVLLFLRLRAATVTVPQSNSAWWG